MTSVTLISAENVIGGFTRSYRAVMTTGAGTNHLRMINCKCRHRYPGSRGFFMAGIAEISAWNMAGTLTTCRHTIVANSTVIKEISVINTGWHPGVNSMTIITWLRGHDMQGRLTSRDNVIVTTGANTEYFIVVHGTIRNRYPRYWTWLMTGITNIGGANM